MDWYERAMREIEDDFNKGETSYEEFRAALRELDEEYRCSQSESNYNDY